MAQRSEDAIKYLQQAASKFGPYYPYLLGLAIVLAGLAIGVHVRRASETGVPIDWTGALAPAVLVVFVVLLPEILKRWPRRQN
jgi:hypothetical protein